MEQRINSMEEAQAEALKEEYLRSAIECNYYMHAEGSCWSREERKRERAGIRFTHIARHLRELNIAAPSLQTGF